MFEKSYTYYDLLKSTKDYKSEAEYIITLIRKLGYKSSTKILDIACGSGEHDKYLAKYYQVDGIDINKHFLVAARKKNTTGNYSFGDMLSFNLEKKYDIMICLHGAIGYLKNTINLEQAVRCFDTHLAVGGCILINPWYSYSDWVNGSRTTFEMTKYMEDKEIVRLSFRHLNGTINSHYLITLDDGISHFVEEYETGFIDQNEIINCFYKLNYSASVLDNTGIRRGLVLCQRN